MTKKNRNKIKMMFGGNCAYCGFVLDDKWQVDHKISKCYWVYLEQEGSVNQPSNLVPACSMCNHYKRSHPVEKSKDLIGFRDYMITFHIRLGKLPKTTQVAATKRRIEYMVNISTRYGITPDTPFNGIFYMDNKDAAP